MAGLKEVRTRIASVQSTEQITNAMKMVAASKLRKAQIAILKLRPYAAKMQEIMRNLSTSAEEDHDSPYTEVRPVERVLLVVITSNKGLCGAFNSNILKAATREIREHYAEQAKNGNLEIVAIGRKASEFFRKQPYKLIGSWDALFDDLSFGPIAARAEELMDLFARKKVDRIDIIYNRFKNAAIQQLMVERYLPLEPPAEEATKEELHTMEADYIFEPDKKSILEEMIPKSLRIQFFKAILDSYAAEMGARMTAMQQATDNARELLKELKISYNKARQNQITNELIEIVSGAEALNG